MFVGYQQVISVAQRPETVKKMVLLKAITAQNAPPKLGILRASVGLVFALCPAPLELVGQVLVAFQSTEHVELAEG